MHVLEAVVCPSAGDIAPQDSMFQKQISLTHPEQSGQIWFSINILKYSDLDTLQNLCGMLLLDIFKHRRQSNRVELKE